MAALVAALAVSCSKENVETVSEEQPLSDILLSAQVEDTKTELQSDGSIYWKANDCILAFRDSYYRNYFFWTGPGNEEGASVTFTPCDDYGTETSYAADGKYYNGSLSKGTGTIYAVYPFNAYWNLAGQYTLSGTTLTITDAIPREQVLTAGTFASGANTAVAISDDPDALVFKNVCSLLKFSAVGDATLSSVTISSNNNVLLSGVGTVDLSAAAPVATLTSDNPYWYNTIYMANTNSVDISSSQDFYAVVPATTVTGGLQFKLVTSNGYVIYKKTLNDLTFNRSKYRNAGSFTVTEDYSSYTTTSLALSGIGDYVGWGSSFSVSGTTLSFANQWKPTGWKIADENKSAYQGMLVKLNAEAPSGAMISLFYDGVGDRLSYDIAGLTNVVVLFGQDVTGVGFENWSDSETMSLDIASVQLLGK